MLLTPRLFGSGDMIFGYSAWREDDAGGLLSCSLGGALPSPLGASGRSGLTQEVSDGCAFQLVRDVASINLAGRQPRFSG
jgi:hypothetical protein